MNLWTRLYDLARRQHQVFARRQALELGIPAATFDRRVRAERWPVIHPGIRMLPGNDATGHDAKVAAALLAIGDHAVATGWSGLYIHGVLKRPPPYATLVVPWNRGARQLHAVRTVRSRTLVNDDRLRVDGLTVATPQRCFLDAARSDSRARLRGMLIDGRQRRIVEPTDVARRAMANPRSPGAHRLIAATADVDTVGADSEFSYAVHCRLVEEGFRPDPHPATVVTPSGRELRPDITFASARACIECDSLGFHGTQEGLDLDHRKNQGYWQAGWHLIRIGWRRFDTDLVGFLADVTAALHSAQRAG